MNESNQSTTDDAVERLLREAGPRATPPDDVEQKIRSAVHDDWLAVNRGRRRRRALAGWSAAAAVLLTTVVALQTLRGPAPAVPFASIERSDGAIYVERAESGSRTETSTVFTGQFLSTANDAAAGLTLVIGGSLRLDNSTRVEIVAEDVVHLHRGRIYLDTSGIADNRTVEIHTSQGVVTHVGTQFIAAIDGDRLVVSVREGEVLIDGRFHDSDAHAGEQVELVGSASPSVVNIPRTGSYWSWSEAMAPQFDANGRSAFEFLEWVARETGHELVFADPQVEDVARSHGLEGGVPGTPREELRLRMLTMDLQAEFDAARSRLVIRR